MCCFVMFIILFYVDGTFSEQDSGTAEEPPVETTTEDVTADGTLTYAAHTRNDQLLFLIICFFS